jgi:hypothetical protein
MIFHGVYTTPQVIDSTLSTTSNNAVNGQAVADYVNAKIISVLSDESDTSNITSPKAVADYVESKAGGGGGITPIMISKSVSYGANQWEFGWQACVMGNFVYISLDIHLTSAKTLNGWENVGQVSSTDSNFRSPPSYGLYYNYSAISENHGAIALAIYPNSQIMLYGPNLDLESNIHFYASFGYVVR